MTIFSGFFPEFAHHGANWRACGPEKRSFWTTPSRERTRGALETGAWLEVVTWQVNDRYANEIWPARRLVAAGGFALHRPLTFELRLKVPMPLDVGSSLISDE
ncbi:MAG: hypothetical protein ACLQVF_34080 [Isosphaeraceae bacterium]